ncbi:hypothetical protein ES703_25274 [subsurface metagenome]
MEIDFGLEFQGNMNLMANSIDLLLGFTLENIGIKPPRMLGNKINKFNESKNKVSLKYTGDTSNLIDKLRRFNNHWNITKHGMIAGGYDKLTFRKDGKFHTFNKAKQDEIKLEFSEIMSELTEIHNATLKS